MSQPSSVGRRAPWSRPHAQATPEEAGATLAFVLSFAYRRWRHPAERLPSRRAERFRARRCRRAKAAILTAEDRVRDAALWDLLDDHHPALVRWARLQLGMPRWRATAGADGWVRGRYACSISS